MKKELKELQKQRQERLLANEIFIGLHPRGENNLQRRNDFL